MDDCELHTRLNTEFNTDWQPSTTQATLQARATMLAHIRQFFAKKNVLEVETPLLAKHTVSAPHLASFRVQQDGSYLQTSPEYAMKRLLAAGSGSIYQICKAFRQAERGTRHNSEFSILEWYRIDFLCADLMHEVAELVQHILGELKIEQISYRDAFIQYAGLDPFNASWQELEQKTHAYIDFQFSAQSRDDFLDLLLSHCVQKYLGRSATGERSLCFLNDFPSSQAALARTEKKSYGEVAQRFEVFVDGLELANAYLELNDATLLAQRWQQDYELRRQLNLPDVAADHYLLAAQHAGLPECAGVALGLDRLLMLQLQLKTIDQVISFTDERA